MPTHKSILQNTLAQISGKAVTVLCSLVVVKLITGIGQSFYGDYVTTYEFLAFFGIIADAGLFAIAVKEMSQNQKKSEFILGNILSLRLLLIVLVCTLAIIAAQFVPTYDIRIKQGIFITALSMGLTIVAGTLSSVLQAKMKIQYFSASLAFGKIILVGSVFYLLGVREVVPAENELFMQLLYAGLFSNLFFVALVYYFVSRIIKIRLQCDWEYWKDTFKVSLPYGMALILQTLYLRLDIILISILLTSQATGIYGVCARIMESFLVLGVFFGQAILPKISAETTMLKNGSFSDCPASQTLTWAIEKILLIALPIVWGGYLFADQIVVILSNE
ncbi:MAG TPA: oligosaccharide flippase family protein, partial [Candidatus Gracilibacteria bacterium]